jgi:TPR repeat protein
MHRRARTLCLLAVVAAALVQTTSSSAATLTCAQKTDRKVALVIGNGHYDANIYQFSAPNLATPPNDAAQVGRELCAQGFAYVDVETDRTKQALTSDLAAFKAQVTPQTKVALIYYSGHGAQTSGMNYIIPVDDGAYLDDPSTSGVPISDVLADLGPARDDLARVLVFDACRNDNSEDNGDHEPPPATSATQYLNLLIEWSSTSGMTSSGRPSGSGELSPYTLAFLSALRTTNFDIPRVHELANEIAFWYARDHYDPAFSVPEPSGQLYGVFHYQPMASDQNYDLAMASKIMSTFDDVNAHAQTTARASNVDVSGMSVSQLMTAAQTAVRKSSGGGQGKAAHMTPDFTDAARYWQAAANQGSVAAMTALGDLYYNGQGVVRDLQEACSLYGIAALENDALGYDRLGSCYRDGKGVTKPDPTQAAAYYQKALSLGLQEANVDLGRLYLQGSAAMRSQAFAKFKAAAAAHVPDAYAWVGWCYYQGVGVTRDFGQATYWLHQSANVGDVQGMEWLATLEQYTDPQDAQAVIKTALESVASWFVTQSALANRSDN